jgi:hypothetical protein
MSHRKKKSFVIKTSIQQTRFSKKDLKDLKQRFEKHSTWVLVDGRGNNIETDGSKPSESEYQSQLKNLDLEKSSPISLPAAATGAANGNSNRDNSFSQRGYSPSLHPNQSMGASEKPPLPRPIMKVGNYKRIEINLDEALIDHGIHYTRKMSR